MARPIEETPILFNEDAKAFLDNMERSEHEKISTKELERMRNNFAKLSGNKG